MRKRKNKKEQEQEGEEWKPDDAERGRKRRMNYKTIKMIKRKALTLEAIKRARQKSIITQIE